MFLVIKIVERELSSVDTAESKNAAYEIMKKDFVQEFKNKYADELVERNLDFERLYTEVVGDDCELLDNCAWMNNAKRYCDIDWYITKIWRR